MFSRKKEDPVATATSKFSISLTWPNTDIKFPQTLQENTGTYYFKCSAHIFKVLSGLASLYLKDSFRQQDNCQYSYTSEQYNFLHRCNTHLQGEKNPFQDYKIRSCTHFLTCNASCFNLATINIRHSLVHIEVNNTIPKKTHIVPSLPGRKLKKQSKHNKSQSGHTAHCWEPLYLLPEWPEQSELCYNHSSVPSREKALVWARFVVLSPRKVLTKAGQGTATQVTKAYT